MAQRLTLEDLASIAATLDTASPAALARSLGRPYPAVAQAVWRMRRAGGWFCRLTLVPCSECGLPVAGPPGRTAHRACARAKAARQARECRRRDPERYAVARRAWLARHPEAVAQRRERTRVRRRAAYERLSAGQRTAVWATLHEAERLASQLTRAAATRGHKRWTPDEDCALSACPQAPARALALALGRSLRSVRWRRQLLRREQATHAVRSVPPEP